MYPPDWYLSPAVPPHGVVELQSYPTNGFPPTGKNSEDFGSEVKILIGLKEKTLDNKTINEWVNNYIEEQKSSPMPLRSISGPTAMNLGDKKVLVVTWDSPLLSPWISYFMENGQHEVVELSTEGNVQGRKQTINEIISTLKFLDDKTLSWSTVNFSPTISLKIPLETATPYCVNSGCYVKETKLPGGTFFQIWGADGANPGGEESLWTYDAIRNKLGNSSFDWFLYDISGHEVISFSSNQSQSTFIMGGNVYSQIEGVFIETKNGMLMIAHYLPKDADKSISFNDDKTLFNQILSTIKFL